MMFLSNIEKNQDTWFGPGLNFENMERMAEHMTNQSLRERFHLLESKSTSVTQVIAQAIETGDIKSDERVGTSRKFARYLPFWA